ncbi:MAG TPA: hypothetical protein VF599_15985 [Pyrinomonadaceae bacterium]|jgi:hypothetical protein
MKINFHLYRTLKTGMVGEDVKKMQHWLNIVNLAYGFSDTFKDGVIENGRFTTFILTIFYHEYLEWSGYPVNHVYDQEIHSYLCTDVNLSLQQIGDASATWTAN